MRTHELPRPDERRRRTCVTPWRLGDGCTDIEMGPRGELQALTRDGVLHTWGGYALVNERRSEDRPRWLSEGFTRLAGPGVQAAWKADGTVWAWGEPLAGMTEWLDDSRDPVPAPIGRGFVQIVAAPDGVTVALKFDGGLWQTTRNLAGVPRFAGAGCGWRRVALSGHSRSSCAPASVVALRDDGALVAWAVTHAPAGWPASRAAAPLVLGTGLRWVGTAPPE